MERALAGRVAVVAGGARGAGRGIAVELGEAGATVYVTGRSAGGAASPVGRPETVEQTAELVSAAGGVGVPVRCDHLDAGQVRALAQRVRDEQGRLDLLVNGLWGADRLVEWAPFWEHDLDNGLRAVEEGLRTHLVTLHTLLPLMLEGGSGLVIEVTDGDETFNAHYRGSMFYDVVKVALARLGRVLDDEVAPRGLASVSLTPGFLRSEAMLDHFGVTEATWRDGIATDKWFAISETPRYIGRAVVALATEPDVRRWAGQSLSAGQLATAYGFTDLDGSRPQASAYFADAYFGDKKDADAADYR